MKIGNCIPLIALLVIGICFQQQGFVVGQKLDEWAIEFDNEIDSIAFAERYGLIHQGQIGPLTNTYLFSKPTSSKRSEDEDFESKHRKFLDMLELPQTLQHPKRSITSFMSATDEEIRSEIKWFEQQELKQRIKRSVREDPPLTIPPTDPLYPNQWHLSGNKSNNQVDINVLGAWKLGYTGKGVTIAIVDDGIDQDHPDIKPNFKQAGSFNFNTNTNNTRPVNLGAHGDWHGTTSAGVAAARDDGEVCGVGVAPRASLSAVVILQSGSVSDAVEARAITHALEVNDIYSNSWGPVDDGRRKEAPGPLTQRAFEHALKKGRNGLGTIYVWAAGNGRRNSDECNYDGYANWRGTVLIGAVSWKGSPVWYSESCAALLGVTPSSGDAARKDPDIVTTDLRNGGLETGQCTSRFTGTSASCPMAAGIVALMLEANPKLSWLDVQYILVESCVRTELDDPDWTQNSAGRWVNHKFGFGLIDTTRAVELSAKHQGNIKEETRSFNSVEMKTWDAQAPTVSATIAVPSDALELHHVEIRVNITHRMRGRLSIVLTAPSGLTSVLANQHSDGGADYNSWRFTSLRHWGEDITGNWTLTIQDSGKLSGEFKDWSLNFYGIPRTPSAPQEDPTTVINDDRGIYGNLTIMSLFLVCVMSGLVYVYYQKRKASRSDPSGVVNIL